ncbi:MAG: hypothetical protein OSB47_01585 [Pirellulaceae bacterium]|nr:hypothetical protein [Pirellulaceae bacterium]
MFLSRVPAGGYLTVSMVCLLLVSCGKSDDKQDSSIQGQLKQAMKIQSLRKRSKTLVEIADRQFEQDDVLGGKATIGLAVDTALEIKGAYERGAVLNSTAYAYGKHQLVDKASDVLKQVSRAVEEVAEADLSAALIGKMAEIEIRFLDHVNTGNDLFKEAATAAENAEKPEEKVIAKLNLAFHLDRLKRVEPRDDLVDQAFEVLEQIPDDRQRTDVTGDMASRLVQMQCLEQSKRAFELAETYAATIAEPLSQGYALCEISDRLRRAEQSAGAERVLAKARQVAEKVTDQGLRKELINRLAQ